jgi:hypothetical protein
MTEMILNLDEYQLPYEVRRENEERYARSPDHCVLCGRGLTEKAVERGWMIHMVDGGCGIAPNGWEPIGHDDESGDMYFSPVGSECAKRVPRTHRTR